MGRVIATIGGINFEVNYEYTPAEFGNYDSEPRPDNCEIKSIMAGGINFFDLACEIEEFMDIFIKKALENE